MRIYVVSLAVAAVLAVGAATGLTAIQETASQAFHTGATRLGPSESVNNYARQGPNVPPLWERIANIVRREIRAA
jgi:hypothetical protein